MPQALHNTHNYKPNSKFTYIVHACDPKAGIYHDLSERMTFKLQ